MTLADAVLKAVQRWGIRGHARLQDGMCVVGTIGGERLANGSFPYGRGWTWEEAFADADRRAALPHDEPAY